jgi:hypothetical protein
MYIASAINRGSKDLSAGGVLQIDRPSGKRPYVLSAMAVSSLALPALVKRPSAILFLNDPETIPQTAPGILAAVYV